MGVWVVMLSVAKHLSACRLRPFAALKVTEQVRPLQCTDTPYTDVDLAILSEHLVGVVSEIFHTINW